ncbi:MAG: hypothetical protein K9M81_02560 [Chthoniobacterales bacterium]|nr:hypothetical protein [Chthoniobacterales bacterium]
MSLLPWELEREGKGSKRSRASNESKCLLVLPHQYSRLPRHDQDEIFELEKIIFEI